MMEMDRSELCRRRFMVSLLACAAGAGSLADSLAMADAVEADGGPAMTERLDEVSALAAAFGYRHDAKDVNLQRFPERGEAPANTHFCANCVLFPDAPDAVWARCTLLENWFVNRNGWCTSWAPR